MLQIPIDSVQYQFVHNLPLEDPSVHMLSILQQTTCCLLSKMHSEYFHLQPHFPLNFDWKYTLSPKDVTVLRKKGVEKPQTPVALSFAEATRVVASRCFDKLILKLFPMVRGAWNTFEIRHASRRWMDIIYFGPD